jgi:hypothetical protein
MGVQGPLYQDSSNNMWKLQGTILVETNFFGIYVLNYIFLSSNIFIYLTLYNCMKIEKSEWKHHFDLSWVC